MPYPNLPLRTLRNTTAKPLTDLSKDTPLVATVLPQANGARVAIGEPQRGVERAVLWFNDLGYASKIAEAINKVSVEHFEGSDG